MLDLVSSCGTTHPKTMLYDLSEQEIESRERIYASCEVLKVLTSTVSKPAPTS